MIPGFNICKGVQVFWGNYWLAVSIVTASIRKTFLPLVFHISQCSSCFPEAVFRPQFQAQRHQAERCIACVEQIGHSSNRVHKNTGIVENICLLQHDRHKNHGQAGKVTHHISPVPVVKAIDGKSLSAP